MEVLHTSQKTANNCVRLVDYKELEENILLPIREGRPLTRRDVVLTSLIKKAARSKFRR
jgi:hypothetical protein